MSRNGKIFTRTCNEIVRYFFSSNKLKQFHELFPRTSNQPLSLRLHSFGPYVIADIASLRQLFSHKQTSM